MGRIKAENAGNSKLLPSFSTQSRSISAARHQLIRGSLDINTHVCCFWTEFRG